MGSKKIDTEDKQLNDNLQLLNSELCSLVEDKQWYRPHVFSCNRDDAARTLLQQLNSRVSEMRLDLDGPQLEVHGLSCRRSMCMNKRVFSNDTQLNKKSHTNADSNRPALSPELQEKNIHKAESNEVPLPRIQAVAYRDNQNLVVRLLDIFNSLHEHISAELPSHQLNSVPSDYVFEIPRKRSNPHSYNIRHQVQVLCTKLERFIRYLRCILKANRQFDYTKYTACDTLLNGLSQDRMSLRYYTTLELRHCNLQFVSPSGLAHAENLEALLLDLRERIKTVHIQVHVFNWEMDIEHLYSSNMIADLEETNKRALALATSELQSVHQTDFSFEEKLISDYYQLGAIVSCAKEHEEFLSTLIEVPENYFPPEIIALCEKPSGNQPQPCDPVDELADSLEQLAFGGDIVEIAPSSPPRFNRRSHIPKCNRA